MILYPAIDILGGKAVRLLQGDFGKRTEYDADPLEAARRWVDAGARALHVVDLDGARTGTPGNLRDIARIASTLPVPLQVGGGLRTLGSVRAVIQSGAARVILGTAAFSDPAFLDAAIASHGDQIIVSIDARNARVATAGWTEQTELTVSGALSDLHSRGVRRFVYSSIDRDGMLSGPDLEGARAVARQGIDCSVIYSGGIGELSDLRALAELGEPALSGVIVGKALYEQRFGVAEAQALLDEAS